MRRSTSIIFILFVFTSLVSPLVLAQCPGEGNTVQIKAPAVSKTSSGELIGVATTFSITVAPGSGHVYVETWPLTEVDMQASARLAAQIAGEVLGVDMSKYDVYIQVRADAPTIGGPSAGGTMTVGIIAALEGWKLRNDVMMTGMINPDGSIGPVGGILKKASAAHNVGAKLFLIPEGQRIQMIEQTEKKQIGPLVQITSKSEPVDVAKYAKERWGLEVIEIKDIYDAVFYFTGHKIEKPQAPENVNIDTSFVKDDALKDYDNTTAYFNEVKKELKESDVDYSTYNLLNNALEDADQKIKSAKDAMDRGMYYTALSLDFQARITIRTVEWSLKARDERDIENLLKNVDSEIKSIESEVLNRTIRGITMLQAEAASEQRIEEAKDYMKDAWGSYYRGDYLNAIGSAAFAYERAQTARFWANLGERYAAGEEINRESVKGVARDYLDNARLIITYISSMFGESYMQDLISELDKGESYYEEGKYSAALFSGIEAQVRANIILDTIGINNETVLKDKLNQMKNDAKTAIAIAQSQGIYPILGIAYYEFAQNYENQTGTDSLINAMIFYQYAKETSIIFVKSKGTPKIETPTTPAIPLVNTTSTQTPIKNETSTQTDDSRRNEVIIYASGALLIGLLLGIGLGRRL
ncbi:MAG: ATP-dependent protease [Palaeococcus sp.]|uniref:S16 family serine protease n=1 Tax=Palaeococcus sp. (in: euryarchaeotes) TaxID=2820298 RepID=UPI0025D8E81C|nr:S16 family serine protease [Palaeococcus sp. (in: euryarchaeotes)]MCD6559750.1 ATP-dependent protease [Palaeococcus sp. (in: euryarchaeotes)]